MYIYDIENTINIWIEYVKSWPRENTQLFGKLIGTSCNIQRGNTYIKPVCKI